MIKKQINKIFYNSTQNSLKNLSEFAASSNYIFLLEKITNVILKCFKKGSKLIICGNGGSAAHSDHLNSEIIGKFLKNKKRFANSVSLTSNSALITSIANDYSYKDIFSMQINSCAKKNDVIIFLTTSGKSKNIIKSLKNLKKKQITSIIITGENKKKFHDSIVVNLPAKRTDKIQELQLLFCHLLCEVLEELYFIKKRKH